VVEQDAIGRENYKRKSRTENRFGPTA